MDLDGERVTRAFQGSGPFIECGVWKFSPDLLGYMMSRKADEYRALARNIDGNDMFVIPKPLKIDQLEKLLMDFGLFEK